ncbi:molecular chaperone TorD family protein [Scrofimicrobium sp. R131]|uniref:Molecular chaperone TorD family protein n=1 Tax=Scrofimicrobium appendicitidis TaxID=3079930 RepID=A0AAU7V5L5_9ACTO
MLTADELDDYAAALATLGRFHRQAPDENTLSAFGELLEEWPVPVGEASSAGLAHLRTSFAEAESAYQIRGDLNRLYGVSAVARVAPYESVHRDRDGLVFDQQTLLVREAYRQLSLQVPRLNREPDDHIGVEVDFLAQCLLRALDALDAGQDQQALTYLNLAREFLAEHLNQWGPDMLAEATEAAETEFMRGVCQLTIGTLDSFTAALEDLPAAS